MQSLKWGSKNFVRPGESGIMYDSFLFSFSSTRSKGVMKL